MLYSNTEPTMSLLDDIEAERRELEADVSEFSRDLLAEARKSVARGHTPHPVVVSIIGPEYQVYELEWRSVHERAQVFDELNEELSDLNATGAAMIMPGHTGTEKALISMTRTPSKRTMNIYPYSHGPDGSLLWHKPQVCNNPPHTDLLRVPELN